MTKRNLCVLIGILVLVLVGCEQSHEPGIFRGSNRIKNMKPRALIATTAMHALLQAQPQMSERDLAKRAFAIADAMITEGEKPGSIAEE